MVQKLMLEKRGIQMNHEARDKAAEFYAEGSFVDANITAEYVAQRGFKDGYDAGHAAAQKEFEESLRVACAALKTYEEFPGAATVAALAHLKAAGHLFTKEGEK
jgi:hypothetical protein